ncbi:hypothetical protein BDA96_09G034000 [Sorghum bicolor]|nr:transcription factor JAMYB [Sorghum bicolor]KAG0516793.1 hypothetical protein BDA96_09G034000 [Sorghum bicolor]|eukprot:XP_002440535.1 transcription factor JAMYB [Sorghum bicolor]
MDDMDMAMAMVSFDDLDQVLAMSPSSSATSSAPVAAAQPAAAGSSSDDEAAAICADLRRGPWTADEDILLVNYIAVHGEGRWNSLARSAGLKRTGKSCRLRWLNYLRPDVRRGNITAEEQLLILDLHSRWGNRWSKIAQHLPGRTDNEIKNYWRTRVQKHARHLRCDVNSASFRHVVRHVWMPRLRERVQAAAGRDAGEGCGGGVQSPAAAPLVPVVVEAPAATTTASAPSACYDYYDASSALRRPSSSTLTADDTSHDYAGVYAYTSAAAATPTNDNQGCRQMTTDDDVFAGTALSELLATSGRDDDSSSASMIGLPEFGFGDLEDGLWSLDDLCLQQLC